MNYKEQLKEAIPNLEELNSNSIQQLLIDLSRYLREKHLIEEF